MDANFEVITGNLRNKFRTIITLYEQNKLKTKELESKNKDLADKINFLEKKLAETEEKFSNMKLAKSIIATDDGSHDARIKMNRIVREIDKCIALLNR